MGRSSLITALVASACLFAGCAAPTWTVVRQADPNPVIEQREWAIETLRFEGTSIDGAPLGAALAGSDAVRAAQPWARDLRVDLKAMNDAYGQRLLGDHGTLHVRASTGSLGSYSVRATLHGISTGLARQAPGYPPTKVAPTEAFVTIVLLDPEGREIDVVDLQTDAANDAEANGPGFDACGVRIADLVLGYLATRVRFVE